MGQGRVRVVEISSDHEWLETYAVFVAVVESLMRCDLGRGGSNCRAVGCIDVCIDRKMEVGGRRRALKCGNIPDHPLELGGAPISDLEWK